MNLKLLFAEHFFGVVPIKRPKLSFSDELLYAALVFAGAGLGAAIAYFGGG
jgi:hypothetical protein